MRLAIFFLLSVVIINLVTARFEGNSYKDYLYKKYPEYKEQVARERESSRLARSANNERRSNTIWTIPVVFHVIYNSAIQNISDAVVLSQIGAMNRDFRMLNEDVSETISRFSDLPTDSLIQFDFAKTDPKGNPTNGITRTKTTTTVFPAPGDNDFEDACKYSNLGGLDAWDTTKYMNVWVCNLDSGILGYATMGPAAEDGIVVTSKYFGINKAYQQNPYNLGRTLTHEMGHWLNLDHTWGDRGSNAQCIYDDDVLDTPKTSGPSYECNLTSYSCNTFTLVQNFMDYPPDGCMVMFTEGQVARMRAEMPDGNKRRKMAYVSTDVVPGLTPEQSLNGAHSLIVSTFNCVIITTLVTLSLYF